MGLNFPVPHPELRNPASKQPLRPVRNPPARGDLFFANSPNLSSEASAPHIALLGNFVPQLCGLATFTADTRKALMAHASKPVVDTYVLHDDEGLAYPEDVTRLIKRDRRDEYSRTARAIMHSEADLLLVEHEFGIFGGEDGCYVLDLIEAVDIPVVVTLHTVLDMPSLHQDAVMRRLIACSDTLIVMAEYGRAVLRRRYGVADDRIAVIPHGIPDFAYTPPEDAKAQFGLEGRKTVLTFGLLSHDKGIDRMIEAMPSIVAADRNIVYIILGATHPNLVASEGEALRQRLQARVAELGIADNIRWVDAFVEMDELVQYLKAADVYVTPYLNPMQITSGTLSYAVGMGKPVVSTPYIHASELLVRGNGVLVPFRDSDALAREVGGLLQDDGRRERIARTAYRRGRKMTWSEHAQALLDRFAMLTGHANATPVEPLVAASAA